MLIYYSDWSERLPLTGIVLTGKHPFKSFQIDELALFLPEQSTHVSEACP